MKLSARILLFAYLLICLFAYFSTPVFAANGTGSPNLGIGTTGTNWVQDPLVTELGKNSERARQLVFWVFSHSPIYRAPVLGEMWGVARNIAYAFVVLTIIGLAAHLVLSRKGIGPTFSGVSLGYENLNLASIGLRIAGVLLFITFSYLIVLGFIQFAEILMRFFIERLGGCDLFNIKFAGEGSKCIFNPTDPNYQKAVMEMEKNYTEFVGYRDTNSANLEMVNTSFFLIKLTSLTYNVMSAILILRQVILWFLLIVSPFLALLIPFIFIRNVGWIWIGTFLQWLFYGPLVALFVAALANIWKAGIPYQFDFSRVDKPIGQIYPTSINILYGGPAQTLSQTNSANFIDTYAEYVIALIMLWATIFLPWLLLRIFRDYCCDILQQNQATLKQILDRLRGIGPTPPPPPGEKPTSTTLADLARELPFRQKVAAPERISKETIIEKIKEREIEKVETREISRAMNLEVKSLQDIARLETNREVRSEVQSNLARIQNPATITNLEERRTYSTLRQEIGNRAARGDRVAQQIMQATTPHVSQVLRVTPQVAPQVLKQAVEKPGMPVMIPQIMRLPTAVRPAPLATPALIQALSQKTLVAEEKVKTILQIVPPVSRVEQISLRTQVSQEKVREVLEKVALPTIPRVIPKVVSEERIKEVSLTTNLSTNKVKEIISIHQQEEEKEKQKIREAAQKVVLPEKQVEKVLASIPLVAPEEKISAPTAPTPPLPSITVEDYEEVKTMWLNHYRQAEVPVTETIKTREGWLNEDIKKLYNTINLLISASDEDKKRGLEEVAHLLPFLLLGDFSDLEMLTYLKAKLEAAKQIQEETLKIEEVKEKVKEEEEETKIKIPVEEKKEEAAFAEATAAKEKEMELKAAEKQEVPKQEDEEEKSPQSGAPRAKRVAPLITGFLPRLRVGRNPEPKA